MSKIQLTTLKGQLAHLFGLDSEGNGSDKILKYIVGGLSDRLLLRMMKSFSEEKRVEFLVVINCGKRAETIIGWIKSNVPDFFKWMNEEVKGIKREL